MDLVLITGTSSGIGLATAITCAEAGFRVVATMRNLEKRALLEEAAKNHGVRVNIEHLDVTYAVEEKIHELLLKYGPFYGLVNNAGIGIGGTFEEQSERDVREQFETNVFGMMAVTRAFLPSMRAARRGRIVNVSSISGLVGVPALAPYCATKHAVLGFSESLRLELEPFNVQVSAVAPGVFKTEAFGKNLRKGEYVQMNGAYGDMSHAIEKHVLEDAEHAPPPDAVAKAIVELLLADLPPVCTLVGTDARAIAALKRLIPARLFEHGLRKLMHLPRFLDSRSR